MLDVDIRRVLRHTVLAVHKDDPDTVVIDELGILQGSSRVDVAVVNGALHGYEIKSERDTLARLPAQVDHYGKVFDFVTLVLSSRHFEAAASMVPKWWGIILVKPSSKGVVIRQHRRERKNVHVNSRDLAELLWGDDVIELLEARGSARGLRGKNRHVLWTRLCEVYTLDEVRAEVRARLKARQLHRVVQPST